MRLLMGIFGKKTPNGRGFARNLSGPICSTDPVKVLKDTTSLLVCTWKKIFAWGCGFFV